MKQRVDTSTKWTYAAIESCKLLDDTTDVSEVFCEHHEDVLVKHKDATFSGLQIKTRAADQPAWKSSHACIVSAFTRFASLEDRFPSHFRGFHFLTNHILHSSGNGQDINWILDCIKVANRPSEVCARVRIL